MSDKIIDIYNVDTWPLGVKQYFNDNYEVLNNFANGSSGYADQIIAAGEYDKVIMGLKPILSSYYLHGYHCTRLTEKEASAILSNGMFSQNADTLKLRIENLILDGILQQSIAEELLSSHAADESNRKHMLWFCFFSPYIAGQSGIERFFRSWGGEALYNSHESNPITGPILNKIGNPYVIEALVPLSGFEGHGFEINFADRYMCSKSNERPRNDYYEGYSTVNLPAENILSAIQHPDEKFIQLTKCNLWEPAL